MTTTQEIQQNPDEVESSHDDCHTSAQHDEEENDSTHSDHNDDLTTSVHTRKCIGKSSIANKQIKGEAGENGHEESSMDDSRQLQETKDDACEKREVTDSTTVEFGKNKSATIGSSTVSNVQCSSPPMLLRSSSHAATTTTTTTMGAGTAAVPPPPATTLQRGQGRHILNNDQPGAIAIRHGNYTCRTTANVANNSSSSNHNHRRSSTETNGNDTIIWDMNPTVDMDRPWGYNHDNNNTNDHSHHMVGRCNYSYNDEDDSSDIEQQNQNNNMMMMMNEEGLVVIPSFRPGEGDDQLEYEDAENRIRSTIPIGQVVVILDATPTSETTTTKSSCNATDKDNINTIMKRRRNRRIRVCIVIGFLMIVVVVVVIVLAVHLRTSQKTGQSSNDQGESCVIHESPGVRTLLNSTTAQTILLGYQQYQPYVDPTQLLCNTTSAQFKTLQWISHNENAIRTSNSFDSNDPDTSLWQQYGMGVLYYSTHGERWTNNDGWMSITSNDNVDPCTWYPSSSSNIDTTVGFASCPEYGQGIQILNLADNNLVGTIPDELVFVQNLTRILLDHNDLSGTLPPSLGLLNNGVTILDVSNNPQLEGTVPDTYKDNWMDEGQFQYLGLNETGIAQ